jgi:hypothetical protein
MHSQRATRETARGLRFILTAVAGAGAGSGSGSGDPADDQRDPARTEAAVLWRLIAGNGREVARAATPGANLLEVRGGIALLVEAISAGTVVTELWFDQQVNRWRWIAYGNSIGACSQLFWREFNCRDSLHRFLDGAPTAPVVRYGKPDGPLTPSQASPLNAARPLSVARPLSLATVIEASAV